QGCSGLYQITLPFGQSKSHWMGDVHIPEEYAAINSVWHLIDVPLIIVYPGSLNLSRKRVLIETLRRNAIRNRPFSCPSEGNQGATRLYPCFNFPHHGFVPLTIRSMRQYQ